MDTVEIAGSWLRTNVNDRNGVTKGMECKRTLDSTYFTLSYFLLFFICTDQLSVMRKFMRNHSQVNRLNMQSWYKDQTKSCLYVRISLET